MGIYQDDGSVANKAIAIAAQQAGKPYIWGAAGPDAFDCSGFVHYAYAGAGLPGAGRQTSHLWNTTTIRFMGDPVAIGTEQPGDLVMPTSGHVGIVIGNGRMWNAPQTGLPVRIDTYPKRPFAIRRVSTPTSINANPITTASNVTPAIFPFDAIEALKQKIQEIYDAIHSFDNALKWLVDGHNWVRIAEVTGGAYMIYSAVRMG